MANLCRWCWLWALLMRLTFVAVRVLQRPTPTAPPAPPASGQSLVGASNHQPGPLSSPPYSIIYPNFGQRGFIAAGPPAPPAGGHRPDRLLSVPGSDATRIGRNGPLAVGGR